MTAAARPRCVITVGPSEACTRFRTFAASCRKSVTGITSGRADMRTPPNVRPTITLFEPTLSVPTYSADARLWPTDRANEAPKDDHMDFKFTKSEERLRRDVRSFLRETLGEHYEGVSTDLSDDDFDFGQRFNKALAQRGWVAPAWPKQYGGLGASYIEQMIFSEELATAGAPGGGRIFGVGMIGPT